VEFRFRHDVPCDRESVPDIYGIVDGDMEDAIEEIQKRSADGLTTSEGIPQPSILKR